MFVFSQSIETLLHFCLWDFFARRYLILKSSFSIFNLKTQVLITNPVNLTYKVFANLKCTFKVFSSHA